MNVVVVESPAKARTINKYLGSDYTVLASYGHVRDLPPKDGSVRPDEDFAMSWQVDEKAEKNLKAISDALKGADKLFLATDPDREGEAISWHVCEILNDRKVLDGVDVSRVVFHEITKTAVLDAIAHPRELDHQLIDAYMARRALDYLVGFTLSPVLWRKLPGSRSAGRVQSVALRLICEREAEIEVFKPQEYWTVDADFLTAAGAPFTARLTHLDGEKLARMGLTNEEMATRAVAAISERDFKVASIERKTVKRRPSPPFTTSTLQQEASRKLGLGASNTMRIAQKLYEGIELGSERVGLITYMRTDSVTVAQEAISATRAMIGRTYGDRYVPEKPNYYKSKAKNAQEAHEAVRPTDVTRRPEDLSGYLEKDELRLYDLIWKRMVASAMEAAEMEQVAVDLTSPDNQVTLRANGSMIKFDGFLKVYQEGRDEAQDNQSGAQSDGADGSDSNDKDRILPPMAENEAAERGEVRPEQHFTKPPPRYTEASLVKRLEELGIGRPSTYASILSVLQTRNYVRLESRRFIPEDRGRMVTAFLSGFFTRYVEYNFTAEMEDKLDNVAAGEIDWKQVLREFWTAFSNAVGETKDLRISEVLDALDEDLGPHFFPANDSGKDPRLCPACSEGRLGLRLGKHGGFIGCSNYPECKYTRALEVVDGSDPNAAAAAGPKELGTDPETGEAVTLRKGPYGFYIQLGEPKEKEKPKRASLLRGMDPMQIELEIALKLLALPREIGTYPATGDMILAGVGRFGPYLKYGTKYASLPADDDILAIGLNRAITVIEEAAKKGRGKSAGKLLGEHPEDGKPVELKSGRYGPYVKHGKVNASIPKEVAEADVTLEKALEWIAARAEKMAEKAGTKKKAAPNKKTAAKKKATKAKKAAPKKKAAEATESAEAADDTAQDNGADATSDA